MVKYGEELVKSISDAVISGRSSARKLAKRGRYEEFGCLGVRFCFMGNQCDHK